MCVTRRLVGRLLSSPGAIVEGELLSVKEMATLLGVNTSTIYRMPKDGELAPSCASIEAWRKSKMEGPKDQENPRFFEPRHVRFAV